jgi:predicted nucleic acid-binding protein
VILAATSVWAGHLRCGDPELARRLDDGLVLTHPLVIGELATSALRRRDIVLGALHALPGAIVASDREVCDFIEREALFGLGLSYTDAHLLAATRLTPGCRLWTHDPKVRDIALRMRTAFAAA